MNVRPSVGDLLPEWSVEAVSAEKMKLLAAILRDPNPIHWDRAAVEAQGHGTRLINQGPINLCYVTNMLEQYSGAGSLRSLRARFTANVCDGDAVVAGGTVSRVFEDLGKTFVDCSVWLDIRGGAKAVEGFATVEYFGAARG